MTSVYNSGKSSGKVRGGKRPNAGRPKLEPTVTISFRVPLKHEHEAKELIRTYKQKLKDEKDKKTDTETR